MIYNSIPGKFCGIIALAVLAIFARPSASCADIILTVNGAGGAEYTTIQSAISAVPAGNTTRYDIQIAPGTYTMTNTTQFKITQPFITLQGMGSSRNSVILTGNYTENQTGITNDPYDHATLVVAASDFIAENLTVQNTAGLGNGQALAAYVKADRAIFADDDILGNQDTLRAEYGRQYYVNDYIAGSVDFIYGHATAYITNSDLYSTGSGYDSSPDILNVNDPESKGFVFAGDVLTGAPGTTSYLGRPWHEGGLAVYNDSYLGPNILAAGWTSGAAGQQTFAEHDDMNLDGSLANVSSRVSYSSQLTDAQVAAYSYANWMNGADGWDPASEVPEPASLASMAFIVLAIARRPRIRAAS